MAEIPAAEEESEPEESVAVRDCDEMPRHFSLPVVARAAVFGHVEVRSLGGAVCTSTRLT